MTELDYYAGLLDNESRLRAFQDAIGAVVRPGDRVLDLGTGLGTYAFFAAAAGAGTVWAVDRDPVVHVAEQLAQLNPNAERVEFIRGELPEVDLPDEVEVLIYEDFPLLLLDAPSFELLTMVQADHLAIGGTMIPCCARVCLAPVQSEALHRRIFPLDGKEEGWLGLDWTPLRPYLANFPRRGNVLPADLLATPLRTPPFSLLPLPGPEAFRVEGVWEASGSATVHALALWFDLETSPGIWISNEPSPSPEPWGQMILPLDPPLEVRGPGPVEVAAWREGLPSGAPGWLAWTIDCGGDRRQGHQFAGLAAGPNDLDAGRRAR